MLSAGLLTLGVWSGWPTSTQQEIFEEVELPPGRPHALPSKALPQTEKQKTTVVIPAQASEAKRFTSKGWALATTEPPNPMVTGLELAAVERFNRELRTQLSSNTYNGPMLDRVRDLAVQPRDAVVRELAIENLARSHDAKAQELLIDCFENITDAASRKQIVSSLKPDSLDGRVSRFLVSQLSSADLADDIKRRALSQLVGASLAQDLSPQEVLPRLPASWRQPFQKLFEGVTKDGIH